MPKTSFFSTTGTTPTNVASIQSALAAASQASAAAELALDSFDDVYLGAKAVAPTVDNDGNALQEGSLYFNTTSKKLKVYDGNAFVDIVSESALQVANNLSDLASLDAGRENLLLQNTGNTFFVKAVASTGEDAVKVSGPISATNYKYGTTEVITSTGELTNVSIDAGNF
jgi:hypothetical protein